MAWPKKRKKKSGIFLVSRDSIKGGRVSLFLIHTTYARIAREAERREEEEEKEEEKKKKEKEWSFDFVYRLRWVILVFFNLKLIRVRWIWLFMLEIEKSIENWSFEFDVLGFSRLES